MPAVVRLAAGLVRSAALAGALGAAAAATLAGCAGAPILDEHRGPAVQKPAAARLLRITERGFLPAGDVRVAEGDVALLVANDLRDRSVTVVVGGMVHGGALPPGGVAVVALPEAPAGAATSVAVEVRIAGGERFAVIVRVGAGSEAALAAAR